MVVCRQIGSHPIEWSHIAYGDLSDKKEKLMPKKIIVLLLFMHIFSAFLMQAMQQFSSNQSLKIVYGTSSEKGNRRPEMEDRYFPNLHKNQSSSIANATDLFGVYDGHGGDATAELIENNFSSILQKYIEKHANRLSEECIIGAFNALHRRHSLENKSAASGSTVVTAIIADKTLWVANVGDAEAVACFDMNAKKATCISEKHTPSLKKESERILNLNGHVIEYKHSKGAFLYSKVNTLILKQELECDQKDLDEQLTDPCLLSVDHETGNETLELKAQKSVCSLIIKAQNDYQRLTPTRNIGDHYFEPWSISAPFVQSHDLTDSGFIILATDGLWDVMEYQAAVDFVIYQLKQHAITTLEAITPEIAQSIGQKLVQKAIDIRDHDNVTATLIFFVPCTMT